MDCTHLRTDRGSDSWFVPCTHRQEELGIEGLTADKMRVRQSRRERTHTMSAPLVSANRARILKVRDDSNATCADCDSQRPDWASVSLGVFICLACSGVHRGLGVHMVCAL